LKTVAKPENPYVGKISQGAAQNIKSPMQKTDDKRAVKKHSGKDLRQGRGRQ
jgi:hypothetical protein